VLFRSAIGRPGNIGGIYQSGAITGANGTSISFISNNNISQNGAIGLVANTSGTAANITYDITYGNKTSTLLTGPLTIPTGSSSSINYIIKTAGSAINPGTIGSASVSLPGYVLLDNTYGCTTSTPACVPVTGFINTITNNLADLSTASVGVTINGAIYARDNIIVNGVSTTGHAISYSAVITSNSGSVILNNALKEFACCVIKAFVFVIFPQTSEKIKLAKSANNKATDAKYEGETPRGLYFHFVYNRSKKITPTPIAIGKRAETYFRPSVVSIRELDLLVVNLHKF
jgi:hypothetical protein